jgi:CheY-like chemotaxis protein
MVAPGCRVLVVDDDGDIRDALKEILEDEGYAVGVAGNGAEALSVLRAGPRPNLVLLDLMMPVMNGWQFRAEQKRDPVLADIPVVVITADAHVGDKSSQIGAEGFLKKPIQLVDLLRTIERYC